MVVKNKRVKTTRRGQEQQKTTDNLKKWRTIEAKLTRPDGLQGRLGGDDHAHNRHDDGDEEEESKELEHRLNSIIGAATKIELVRLGKERRKEGRTRVSDR
jgi:hypothetical protein